MTDLDRAREHYLASFAELEPALAAEPAALRTARRDALDRFAALGLPSTREEEWRFTDLGRVAAYPFVLAPEPAVEAPGLEALMAEVLPDDLGGSRLVFVNGHLVRALSRLDAVPSGATVGSLSAVLRERPGLVAERLGRQAAGGAFAALNAAFARDGAFVHLPRGTAPALVNLVFVALPGAPGRPLMAHPRTVIVLDAESRATVVETYVGAAGDPYLVNAVTTIDLGMGAALEYCQLRREGPAGFHLGGLEVRQGPGSRLAAHAVDLGGALTRADLRCTLAEDADCTLGGLYLVGGGQHVDNHTVIEHARPRGRSRERYKGVLDGTGRAVFDGKVVVRPGAQQTDAVQANHNLLLSDDAVVNTKPQFNIHADDVRCTHGATVGRLSEEELFYLRSRGLDLDEARRILVYAFASEVLSEIAPPPLRARLGRLVAGWLPDGERLREAA